MFNWYKLTKFGCFCSFELYSKEGTALTVSPIIWINNAYSIWKTILSIANSTHKAQIFVSFANIPIFNSCWVFYLNIRQKWIVCVQYSFYAHFSLSFRQKIQRISNIYKGKILSADYWFFFIEIFLKTTADLSAGFLRFRCYFRHQYFNI